MGIFYKEGVCEHLWFLAKLTSHVCLSDEGSCSKHTPLCPMDIKIKDKIKETKLW